jgi:hypothetical protein
LRPEAGAVEALFHIFRDNDGKSCGLPSLEPPSPGPPTIARRTAESKPKVQKNGNIFTASAAYRVLQIELLGIVVLLGGVLHVVVVRVAVLPGGFGSNYSEL